MVHVVEQLIDEIWGAIRRHKYENDIFNYHAISALEAVKFELLRNAFDEEASEDDLPMGGGY